MSAPPAPPWQPRFQSVKVEVIRALGRGAFGEVSLVKASPVEGGGSFPPAAFALKRTSLAQISEAGLEHAQSEAKLLQRLGEEHESILQCFDFRVVPGHHPALELLLEFAPLGDLSGRIKAHKESEAGRFGGLPEAEAVSYGCDVAAGLAHIHSLTPKVLHRDVKPANVVLFPTADGASWDDGTPRAKLADFGIAKVLEADGSLAGANTVIGTPHYFSPEICRGETYDERSDAWALGCVIYEMLCLHRPFHQAEGNIAVLALRVMEGRYDKDALVRQAGCYNGLLIFALTGLLTLDPQQRSRAAEVLQPLGRLRGELGAAAAAMPWWEVDPVRLAGPGGQSAAPTEAATASGCTSGGASDESWGGAHEVNTVGADGVTVNPLQEAVSTLRHTVLPSPKWKRTAELLLQQGEAPAGDPQTINPDPQTINPDPPTINPDPPTINPNPQTINPHMAAPCARTQGSEPTMHPDRTANASPVPESLFNLSQTSMYEVPPAAAASGSNSLAGTAHFGQEGTTCGLGGSFSYGETVRLGHFPTVGREDGEEASAQNMAPSRLAWMGMSGMLDMMSEPPSAEGLGQTLRTEPSCASDAPQTGEREEREEASESASYGAWREAAAGEAQEVPRGEGGDHTWWAEPRIFLRPLWRPSGAEPPPPDAPVMFCFTRDEPGQHVHHHHYYQPPPRTAEEVEAEEEEDEGQPEEAPAEQQPQGAPQSYHPPGATAYGAHAGAAAPEPSGCVLTGRGSVLDPAHGWLEVELTVENAAALYAHMRAATPQQRQPSRGELGGIFELTAVG